MFAMYALISFLAIGVGLLDIAQAVTCNLTPSYAAPVLANGWKAQLVATGLSDPRSVTFDRNGNLLVVQQGVGVVHLDFEDGGSTCLRVSKKTNLITASTLNHGIALSKDGNTLYASSSDAVYSWSYDPDAVSVGTSNHTLVTGMSNSDHTTRTLLLSQREPGWLLVSRGSQSNIDLEAESIESGHSQIKAFNISNLTSASPAYGFTTTGRLLGWGLRNSVGVAEEPLTGGIYSVENSADEIKRNGVDIHQNNPGEELNFHGFLNSSTGDQGGNYGYPYCFAVWDISIPSGEGLKTGDQFTLEQNITIDDTFCRRERVPPRLTFHANMAPLDIKFLPNGTEAYVSFHGSWDRSDPVGYKLSSIAFASGSPVAAADSMTAAVDIMTNPDNSKCPDGCFRPVGLALDDKGRIFMSSDATGEIWVVERTANATGTGTTTGTGTAATPSASG
ncbi:soluble quino protein glucose/sorbosone dehydrogenase [Rhexocercosporidium sp. MPI-PUGE-AT-0058]|nr:soluble quino protein glucose/sorbosone dehydrogenase [Rhexocercosporidium sp. MPI-PUGE-AT-0058]